MAEAQKTAALRAVAMPVYPTLDSLDAVMALAESKLPIVSKNELHSLLMTYHNTLLAEIHRPPSQLTKEPHA